MSFPLAARKYILRFVPSRNFESALMIAANKLSNFRSCPHCPILTLVRTISGHAGTGLSTECGGIKPRSDRIAQELAPLARFRVHWLPSMRACFLLFLELLCRARVGALSCFELNLSRRSCRRVSDRNGSARLETRNTRVCDPNDAMTLTLHLNFCSLSATKQLTKSASESGPRG